MTQLTGSQIGPYEILEQIGAGGMATVYRARQTKLDRPVALKIMHQAFQADPNFAARFEREAQIVARLDHPNIIPLYDYDTHEGRPYLVMKVVEGRTLKNMLSEKALTLDEIMAILPPIASALTYAHSQGILHRDVKPSNIILDASGTPYLMDFGLARVATAGESTLSADMILGTPQYISPEQAQGGGQIDARADVYSLGVVLYELVVGQAPFTGDTPYIIVHKHIFSEPPPPSQVNPEVPPAVEAVILKALAKQPDDRYATPDDLATAFREAVRASGLSQLSADRASRVMPRQDTPVSPAPVYRRSRQGDDLQNAAPSADSPWASLRGGNKSISIPSPVDPAYAASPPARQDVANEVLERVRETVEDIRAQVMQGDFFNTAKSTAEKAFVEIKSQVEAAQQTGSAVRVRQARLINREWGYTEAAIRARIKERRERRNGFFVHLLFYLIIGGLMLGNQANLLAGVQGALSNDAEALALFNAINIPLTVMLLWTAGLFSHGVETFANTGRRLQRRRRAIDEAMTLRYGEDWIDTADDRAYKAVRKRINQRFDALSGVVQHAGVVMLLIAAFTQFWLSISPVLGDVIDDAEALAVLQQQHIVIGGFAGVMLLSLILHALGVVFSGLLGSGAAEREIERELLRQQERRSIAISRKAKNDERYSPDDSRPAARVRLTEDGELTDSFIDELDAQTRPDDDRRRR